MVLKNAQSATMRIVALILLLVGFCAQAQQPGTVEIFSPFAPPSTNAPYPVVESRYVKGGLLTGVNSVAQLYDTNFYPLSRRVAGQRAKLTNGVEYVLGSDLVTWTPSGDNPAGFRYTVYSPTVTRGFVYDSAGVLKYNHDADIIEYGGKFWAAWNAATNGVEGEAGQFNALSTSTDGVTWTPPVAFLIDPAYSDNPVPYNWAQDKQWQPSFLKVGTELWCIWSQEGVNVQYPDSQRIWFSRLRTPTGKWENTQLPLILSDSGKVFYGFPTQKPIQLQSGRVLAPLVWTSPTLVSPAPPNWAGTEVFWMNEKRAGVIYTDDNGATWRIGGFTTLPGKNHVNWEPTVAQNRDGSIRMWSRNLDYKNYGWDQALLSAQGFSDGLVFSQLEPVRIETASTRVGTMKQLGPLERTIAFANDSRSTGNGTQERYNLAVYSASGLGAQLIPGPSFSGTETIVSYPQGIESGGKLRIVYSRGPIPGDRSIRYATVDPAPPTNSLAVMPRANDRVNPFVAFQSGPPAYFDHGANSTLYAVTNSVVWGAETKVTLGGWFYLNNASTLSTLWDNRDNFNTEGFVLFVSGGNPYVNFPNAPSTPNLQFSSLTIPSAQWFYLGLSIDLGTANVTAYLVNAAGTATTQSLTANAASGNYLAGVAPYIGSAVPGSSLLRMVGRVRSLQVKNGVAGTVDNHRFWHGQDQSALSAADWSGTETDPGTPFYSYKATDPSAGSNDATWLAQWSATGNAFRGDAYASVIAGTNVISITGTGSASVELPQVVDGQQLLWASRVWITNKTSGYDQVLLTVGDRANRIELVSRANTSTVEVFDAATGLYRPAGTYRTGGWVPVSVIFRQNQVSLSFDNQAQVSVFTPQFQPQLLLGLAYTGIRAVGFSDGIAWDVDTMRATTEQLLSNASIPSALTSLTLASGAVSQSWHDTSRGKSIHMNLVGTQARFSQLNSPLIADTGFAFDPELGSLNLYGTGAYEVSTTGLQRTVLYSIGTSGSHNVGRGNGTWAIPTTVTSGQAAGQYGFFGHDGSAFSGARSGMYGFYDETWTPSAHGMKLVLRVTPNGTITPIDALVLQNNGALSLVGDVSITKTAPIITLTSDNGTSGGRIQVSGGGAFMLRFMDEYGITRHTFYSNGVYELPAGGKIRLGASGSTISFGTGAPAATEPDGSVYHRSDGTGPNLYTRKNGVWVAALTAETDGSALLPGLSLTNTAPVVTMIAGNGTSGGRITVSGGNSFMMRFLDEYANTRHTWFTNGVYQLPVSGYIEYTSGGPRDGSGSGAPAAAWPNGSTWRRTDGTGPNFYVRENGAWVAK